jgi:hypothetical protein
LLENEASFSVSRVNERFLEVVLIGWGCAFAVAGAALIWPGLLRLDPMTAAVIDITLSLAAFTAGACRLIRGQKSELDGRAFDRATMKPWP